MLEVDQLRGAYRAPSDTIEALAVIGGRNPYDQPMWRLVMAQSLYRRRAGVRKIWNANLSIAERGGLNMETGEQHDNHPMRVETGMYEGRKYPNLEGWILERWYAPQFFSKAIWFANENCLAGGTPKLGPFPEDGMYRMVYGPYSYVPSVSQLGQWIRAHYRTLEARPSNPEELVRQEIEAAHVEEERQSADLWKLVDAMVSDRIIDENRVSLAAGRHREMLANRLREKGVYVPHCGN